MGSRREFIAGALLAGGMASVMANASSSAASVSNVKRRAALTVVPEPPQAPAQEGFLDVGGARLWYWDTGGDGEAVVLLHPATGSGEVWPYQQPVFAKAGYRVIGYSRRGFYKSDITDPSAKFSAADDLQKLLQHLKLSKVHLVGSAAGSFLAAEIVVHRPTLLHSVVLASSMLGLRDPDFVERQSRLMTAGFGQLPEDFRELGPSYRALNPQGVARWVEIQQRARTEKRGEQPPPLGSSSPPTDGAQGGRMPPVDGARSAVTYESLSAAASRTPTLLMTADCDLYMPPALLEHVAAKIKHAELAIIEDAGHAAFWEQSADFNRIVLEFIGRH